MSDEKAEIGNQDMISLPKMERKKLSTNFQITKDETMYDTASIEIRAEDFSTENPGANESDKVLSKNNPGLLALKNKSKKSTLFKPQIKKASEISEASSMLTVKKNQSFQYINESAKKEKQLVDIESMSIAFQEDPIAYFFKHKDGTGHLFIYLTYSKPRIDRDFSPYDLKKVPHNEIGNDYYTMSSNGVIHIYPDGSTDTITLDGWTREAAIFKTIQKLKFFSVFMYWKQFRIWKKHIQYRRYLQTTSKVMTNSLFNNSGFFASLMNILQNPCDNLLKQYLLTLHPQRKYTLNEYLSTVEKNRELLSIEYLKFLTNVVDELLQLDSQIRDPQRIDIKSTDFLKNRNQIPNLGLLMEIEEKISSEKNRRSKLIQKEVLSFGRFVRMVDYMILESLSNSCYQCWKIAESNVCQEMSSVFQVSLDYNDDGSIRINPSLDELVDSVINSIELSISTIDSLPRIIKSSYLRPHLRESHSNYEVLITKGPTFKGFVERNKKYESIVRNIKETLVQSYQDSISRSQNFKEFFNIFRLGKTWKSEDYIFPRGSEKEVYDLTQFANEFDREQDPIVFMPYQEKIVDFVKIRNDVEMFKQNDIRLGQFRACTVSGALFIDSKVLRSSLTPIPMKSIQSLHISLQQLLQQKIDHVNLIFRFCSKRLKKEPNSLEQFVDNSEFLTIIHLLKPHLSKEIEFIDDLFGLVDSFGFAGSRSMEHTRNPLHSSFRQFLSDIQMANSIRESYSDRFMNELNVRLREKKHMISSFQVQLDSSPPDLVALDISLMTENILILQKRIDEIEPEIGQLDRCQRILNVSIQDLTSFTSIKNQAKFLYHVYESVKEWQRLSDIISHAPLNSIDILKFSNDINHLFAHLNALNERTSASSGILSSLITKVSEFLQIFDQVIMLTNAKMQFNHWNRLFEDCGHPKAYYGQIKIEELISYGILNNKDRIEKITTISQGESELEAEYVEIEKQWKQIHLPILESQSKSDDYLILGDLSHLYQKIADSQISLHRMLLVPYAHDVKDKISNLSTTLDTFSKIFDAWSIFQSNWVILSSFFSSEDTVKSLPVESNRFVVVHRRWLSLVRHARENTLLFHVLSFPSLLEMMLENNSFLEYILVSLLKHIDNKRIIFPRLFFISNDEVLTLMSSLDFERCNYIFSKMFMHMRCLEVHPLDNTELLLQKNFTVQNFQRFKVFGFTGESGDILLFTKNVTCTGSVEQWGSIIIDTMKSSVQSLLSESLYKYHHSQLFDWINSIPIYHIILTLQISFTREIEECFNNFENNVHTFTDYIEILSKKIYLLNDVLGAPLNPSQIQKISTAIIVFDHQIEQTTSLAKRIADFSQRLSWNHHLRLKFNENIGSCYVEYGDYSSEHGYEFWGMVKPLIHNEGSDHTMKVICHSLTTNQYPLLFGSIGTGRKLLISNISSYFGRFLFFAPAFKESIPISLQRLFAGSCATGSWLVVNDIDIHNETTICELCNIYKNIRDARLLQQTNIQIGYNDVSFFPSCRFILTIDQKSIINGTIPDNLKSQLMPISYSYPNILHISQVKLLSIGFKNNQILGKKLYEFLKVIVQIFKYIPVKSELFLLMKISEISSSIIYFMMKNDSFGYLSYASNPFNVEIFVLAQSCYHYFFNFLLKEHEKVFLEILYSHFKLYDTIEEFSSNLSIKITNNEELIMNAINLINSSLICPDILKDYLNERTKFLHSALQQFSCVIIYGPPNSGKSQIVDNYCSAISYLSESQNNYKPIVLYEIYHQSDIESVFFGRMDKQEDGPTFRYGQLHSYIGQIDNKKNEYSHILRFNGDIDSNFINFIRQTVSSSDLPKLIFHPMITFTSQEQLHIIIETSSIDSLDPSIIPLCGLVPMTNISITNKISTPESLKQLKINLAFSRISNIIEGIDDDIIKEFKISCLEVSQAVFDFIRTSFVSISIHSDEQSSMTNEFISFVESHFNYCSILLALMYFKLDNSTNISKKLIRNYVLHSYFYVFSTIFESNMVSGFDLWFRSTFLIDLPSDWVGFDVPSKFWDVFPRPSLFSMRVSNGEFVSHDFSILNESPIIYINPFSRIVLSDDISLMTAQNLPQFFFSELFLEIEEPIIIFGASKSGKTSFIKHLIRKHDEYELYSLPISSQTTGNDIKRFLSYHTPILSRENSSFKEKKTLILFDNVPNSNTQVIDLIRSLISNKNFIKFSENDSKHFELIKLPKFKVIVTTESINGFPHRFLKLFMPICLYTPVIQTNDFIFNSISSLMGIPKVLSENMYSIVEWVSRKASHSFCFLNILDMISLIHFKEAFSRSDYLDYIRALLSELNFFYLHKVENDDEWNDFRAFFDTTFNEDDVKVLYHQVIEGESMFYPELEFVEGIGRPVSNYSFHQLHLIKEELVFLLSQYRTRFIQAPELNFYRPMIVLWVLIQRSIALPGRHVFLYGEEGSGRLSLSCFTAVSKGYEFIEISPYDSFQIADQNKRRQYLNETISSIINQAVFKSKTFVIFIRFEENYLFDIELLSHLYLNNDFLPFFPNDTYKEICIQYQNSFPNPNSNIHSVRQQISEIIKARIKFIISSTKPSPKQMFSRFSLIKFSLGTLEFLETCASDALANSSFRKFVSFLPLSVPKIIAQIHSDIASRFPSITVNQFHDFLNLFISLTKSSIGFYENQQKKINSAIDFIVSVRKKAKDLEGKYDNTIDIKYDFKPEDEKKRLDLLSKRDTINARLSKIITQQNEKQTQMQKLSSDLDSAKTLLQNSSIQCDLLKNRISSLSQNSLNALRLIDGKSCRSLCLVLEMACLYCGQPPHFEPYGRRLLNDPQFLNIILNKVVIASLTQKGTNQIRALIDEGSSLKNEMTTISLTLGLLFDWMAAVFECSILSHKIEELHSEKLSFSTQLNKFMDDVTVEKDSIEQVSIALHRDIEMLEIQIADREKRLSNMRVIKEKIDCIKVLLQGFDLLDEKWMHSSTHFRQEQINNIGKVLIFSAFLVYFGLMDIRQQKETIASMMDCFNDSDFIIDPQEVYNQILIDLYLQNDTDKSSNDFINDEIEIHTMRMKFILRPPLIIDPDGILMDELAKAVKPSKVLRISLYSKNIISQISLSIEKGFRLFIYDVNELHPILHDLLKLGLSSSQTTQQALVFKGKSINVHRKFSLFLITSHKRPEEIPLNLSSRVTLIDTTHSCLNSIQERISLLFINEFDPNNSHKITNINRSLLLKRVQFIKSEMEVIDIISDIIVATESSPDYDFMNDEDTVSNLIRSQNCILKLRNINSDEEQQTILKNNICEPYQGVISLCYNFWISLTRVLPQMYEGYFIQFEKYINCIKMALSKFNGKFNEGKIKELVIVEVIQAFSVTMPLNIFLAFLFSSAYHYKYQQKNTMKEDFDSLVLHLYNEYENTIDPIVSDTIGGDSIEQLRFSNVTSVFNYIQRFLTDIFGLDFEKNIPFFSANSVFLKDQKKPVIVVYKQGFYPGRVIENYMRSKSNTKTFLSLYLTNDKDLLENSLLLSQKAFDSGTSIIIHGDIVTPCIASYLSAIYDIYSSKNSASKIVFIIRSISQISRILLNVSEIIFYESFPSPRQYIRQLIINNSSSIQASENSSLTKKLALMYSIVFYVIRARSYLTPLGLFSVVQPDEIRFRNLIERTNRFVETKKSTFSLLNFRTSLDLGIIHPISINNLDKIKLYHHSSIIITPSSFDEKIIFSKFSQSDNTVINFPLNQEISSYIELIQTFPFYPNCSFLSIDPHISQSLIQWKLSRWVIEPMKKLIKKDIILFSDTKARLASISTMIPEIIITSSENVTSPLFAFLISEIKAFNNSIFKIQNGIHQAIETKTGSIFDFVSRSEIPTEWKNSTGISETRNLIKFFSILKERSLFLQEWYRIRIMPNRVDLRMLDDISSFFYAMKCEYAIRRQIPSDELMIHLRFKSMNEDKSIEIYGLMLMAANWDFSSEKIIESNNRTHPFISIPNIQCVIEKQCDFSTKNMIKIPLFRTIPDMDYILERDISIIDSRYSNHICDIYIDSDIPEKVAILNGTGLVCHVPDIFI